MISVPDEKSDDDWNFSDDDDDDDDDGTDADGEDNDDDSYGDRTCSDERISPAVFLRQRDQHDDDQKKRDALQRKQRDTEQVRDTL